MPALESGWVRGIGAAATFAALQAEGADPLCGVGAQPHGRDSVSYPLVKMEAT